MWPAYGVGLEGMRVTDNGPWQSPSGETPPPSPSISEYAAPGQMIPVAPPVWTPPPKPGLIPLRPLGLGDILSASFRVLRRNPRAVVGASLLIKAIVAIITIGVVGLVTVYGLTHVFDSLTDTGDESFSLAPVVQSYVSTFVGLILGLIANALLQGIITLEVARGTVGEKLPLAGLWRRARGRIGALIGWSAAIGGVVLGAALIVTVIVALLVTVAGAGGIAAGVIVAVIAFLGAIVLGVWIGTKVSLVPSVLLLERLPLSRAIARSWSLTKNYFWRTFGIEILVSVIVGVATSIVLTPVSLIISFVTLTAQTSIDTATSDRTTFITFAISTVISAVIGAITAIITTSSLSLLYIDLRIRKEGLDLDLMRFVEGRANGATDLPDPYLIKDQPAEATFAAPDTGSQWA